MDAESTDGGRGRCSRLTGMNKDDRPALGGRLHYLANMVQY